MYSNVQFLSCNEWIFENEVNITMKYCNFVSNPQVYRFDLALLNEIGTTENMIKIKIYK